MVFGVMARAVEYNGNDAARIHHLIRVHSFARIIGKADGFDENNQKITELAAILHDIGLHNAEKKYNSIEGKYQELEGEPVARAIMEEDLDGAVKEILFHPYIGRLAELRAAFAGRSPESLLFMIRDRVDSEELKVVLKVLDGLETWVKEA